jgi:hypothetical protein
MRRIHSIEIHDQTWCPPSLRDALTDTLQFALHIGNHYAPAVPRLRKALEAANERRVIDLCSGGGGPWLRLLKAFEEKEKYPVDVLLTDMFPNIHALERVRRILRNRISFEAEPVDAKHVPARLAGFRTLFSSFHHFRPIEARAILQDAAENKRGIGIFEFTHRDPLAILLFLVASLFLPFFVPFIRPFRWSRWVWTYLIPVFVLVAIFDGVVSCLRTYSVRELRELTAELSANGYRWEMGEDRSGPSPVPITYLIGIPEV